MNLKKCAHVWVGRFSSEEALEAYFEEQYESENNPINQFAADQKVMWYDHDWAERIFHNELSALDAVMFHGYFESAREKIQNSIEAKDISNVNVSVMLLDGEIDSGRDASGSDYSLEYLGCFEVKF